MYRNVLVATDGSEHADRAATHALELADRFDSTVHVLYVIETRTAYDNAIVDRETVLTNLREEGEAAIDSITDRADDIETETTIREGVPGDVICSYIDSEGIDIVYLGERGQSDFKTVLLGSTAEAVIHGTEIPVVVL